VMIPTSAIAARSMTRCEIRRLAKSKGLDLKGKKTAASMPFGS